MAESRLENHAITLAYNMEVPRRLLPAHEQTYSNVQAELARGGLLSRLANFVGYYVQLRITPTWPFNWIIWAEQEPRLLAPCSLVHKRSRAKECLHFYLWDVGCGIGWPTERIGHYLQPSCL